MTLNLIELGADFGHGDERVVEVALLDAVFGREVLVVVEGFDCLNGLVGE